MLSLLRYLDAPSLNSHAAIQHMMVLSSVDSLPIRWADHENAQQGGDEQRE